MKYGNMRTYRKVLTEKLVSEKCTTRASPCVRYFVDAEGNRITEPEKVAAENRNFDERINQILGGR